VHRTLLFRSAHRDNRRFSCISSYSLGYLFDCCGSVVCQSDIKIKWSAQTTDEQKPKPQLHNCTGYCLWWGCCCSWPANSLHHAKDYLGEFFRRITRKLGKPQAITATAHKLAPDCVSPAQHQSSLQRNRLSPLRRGSSKTCAISTPQTSRTAGISTHPRTERMMFLGVGLWDYGKLNDQGIWCGGAGFPTHPDCAHGPFSLVLLALRTPQLRQNIPFAIYCSALRINQLQRSSKRTE
jgi:hypothetical protein